MLGLGLATNGMLAKNINLLMIKQPGMQFVLYFMAIVAISSNKVQQTELAILHDEGRYKVEWWVESTFEIVQCDFGTST